MTRNQHKAVIGSDDDVLQFLWNCIY